MLRLALILVVVMARSASAADAPDFDRDIAPIFVTQCMDCHSGASPKGKLDLSSRATAMMGGEDGVVIVAGNLDESPMWDLVERGKMPPKKGLAAGERELIKTWIASGAKWGTDPIDAFSRTTEKRAGRDWWSLQPVKRPELPAVKKQGWTRNGIDSFVQAKLEENGLAPSGEASKRVLIRRVFFDLIGLPPAPAEVDAFLKDEAADAYEKVVDRLLASKQYGVRWARHWLDVARYGESNGFEHDEFRANAWPYRDWVVSALNSDMPYDEFARMQIAGDVIAPESAAGIAATGFLVAGAYDSVGQTQQSLAMRKVVRQDELEDMTGTVGQTFLGLTVQCARCHDHKFDPIGQKEYYRLTAALAGAHPGEREMPVENGRMVEAGGELVNVTAALENLEKPARVKILAGRKKGETTKIAAMSSWDFREGLKDKNGRLDARLMGKAELGKEGLVLDGKSAYAIAGPVAGELRPKTLEAWVKLDSPNQRSGGVVTVEVPGGDIFDSIIFGEKEPGRWMAGSEFFARWKSFGGEAETEPHGFVQIVIVYGEDGTITAYRNGKKYGGAYKTSLQTYKAGAEIVFGLRHLPSGPGKHLAGVIQRAAIYDRALSANQVAALAGASPDFVSSEEIATTLSPEERERRQGFLDSIERDQKILATPKPRTYAVAPRPPERTCLLVRGNTAQPAEEVSAGGVAAVCGVRADFGLPVDASDGQRRTALANWITDAKNSLFSRVIVNRLWHYHFGVGLVETPNDFGFNGGRCSHLELLDYLAAELVEKKFSLKAMQRMIVTSATYRQSSRSNEKGMAVDAGDRLLWRKAPLRMEAEEVRDTVLSLAGELDLGLGGPGFMEYSVKSAPGTITNTYTPVVGVGPGLNRRTLYRAWPRGGRSGLLDALDCPDPSATAPARAVTNTPLQALAMLNNAAILRGAEGFARRLDREAEGAGAKIMLAYRLAYGREPSAAELKVAREAVAGNGLSVLTRAIFNSNEFLFVE